MPAVQRLTQHLASSGRYLQINSEYALQLLKRSVQGDSAPLSVLQKTELLSEKYLKSSGVKVKPLDRKSYLEPTEGGGKGSSVSRLEVVELPEPLASTSGYSQALFHPEMAAYKKKLEDMGYKLVIDPTLSITDVAGYHQRETMTVALGVESSWTTFRHEFRHAEFADAIGNYRKFIDHYNLKATNKSLLEIWGGPGGPVEKLGKESVLKIEKMVKQGQNELAINETLAVDAELKSLGWKRFIPVVHATHVDYAYSYQVKSAGKAGKDATISRRKMWAQEVGAGIAVVGGGIKSLNELFSESVQVLYRADGEMIAQSKDGTWVQIIPEKDKSK
ncbi:MAG TPA: hypothetical protein VGE46_05295, partial [Bdellovibrio sp.]